MTVILRSDQVNPDPETLKKAAEIIRNGGTVVFPTETVYGLGANALSADACRKIFQAKNRPPDNPLIVHVSSMEQLAEVTEDRDPDIIRALESVWPGPLTVLMKRSSAIPDAVTAGLETVAVRMPANPLALKLIELSGVPVAAPSANIATRPSIVDSSEAIEELMGRVDAIIDAGPTFFGIESTILNTMKRPVELMRPGSFDQDELEPYFGRISVNEAARGLVQSEIAITPGMKYRHYAPAVPMYIVESPELVLPRLDPETRGQCEIIMSREKLSETGLDGINLGSEKDMYSIARNLFPSFRSLEKSGKRIGLIQEFPEKGVGLAIMNRIRKATAGTVRTVQDIAEALSR